MSHGEVEQGLETIVAVATPPGKGGVGVIRVSGPKAEVIAETLLGKKPLARQATLATFKDHANNIIDQGIALFFPNPYSFTGEDVLELQAHGGPIILQLLLDEILKISDVRHATAGEFSQRAFLNNKMDLLQAEAIADLIDSHSKTAARCAARSLQGEFSNKINDFIQQLIEIRMYVESAIDFPDEDIEFIEHAKVEQRLLKIDAQLENIYSNAQQGCLLREGVSVVIIGLPNVGKSSLLNLLAQQEIAIVTDIPGTTRDVIDTKILLDEIPLHLIDTAGVCESDDVVEKAGVARAWQQVAQADLVLYMQAAGNEDAIDNINLKKQLLSKLNTSQKVLYINNKIDLVAREPGVLEIEDRLVNISVKKQQGLDFLKQAIKKTIGAFDTNQTDYLARERHLQALKKASHYIKQGLAQLKKHAAAELLAEDLRSAQNAMSEMTGEFSSDDLLGEIFANFCVGK